MIYHYKDNLQGVPFIVGNPLKYSGDFTFIPIRVKNVKEFMIQTPKLFCPYGIQTNQTLKGSIMLSFLNKSNDSYVNKFIKDLTFIHELFVSHYRDRYNVNSFLKKYKGEIIMNVKHQQGSPVYDTHKHVLPDIPLYSYASFILYLAGIWISNGEVWFQWYNLQARIENNISLSIYSFKDTHSNIPPPTPPPPPPPKNKYQKMLSMGIPREAVEQQKTLDISKTSVSTINPTMLQSIKLKSTTSIRPTKSDMNGFEAPSLDSLRVALQNLRNTIKDGTSYD